MPRRNGPVIKSTQSVLRPEESLWWERFAKDVGFEQEVKERVRRCGRSTDRRLP